MRIKTIAAVLIASVSLGCVAFANPTINIFVNDKAIKTSAKPRVENGSVIASARDISTALGCEDISWNNKTKTATFKTDEKEIKITIGEKTALVDGKKVQMSTSAKSIDGYTFVPVRFVAENFGASVLWNQKEYSVNITKKAPVSDGEKPSYTTEEVEWLAKIVNAEAGGEVMSGKIGVANVVLNRVEHKDFPSTIYDVIFDRKYGVQFTPVLNGTIHNQPTKDSYTAAKRALEGENTVGDSLFFLNPLISTSFWIPNNRTFYITIGGHDFYL